MSIFEDIIIGEKTWRSYSSCRIFKDTLKDVDIAQNSIFYNASISFLEQRLIICKNTEEGNQITNYLNDPELNEQDLQNYIDSIGVQHMDFKNLKVLIDEEKRKAFRAGKRQAKREIKKVLFEEE